MCKLLLLVLVYFSIYVSCHADIQDIQEDKTLRLEARIKQLESMLEDYGSFKSTSQSYMASFQEITDKISSLQSKLTQVEENGRKECSLLSDRIDEFSSNSKIEDNGNRAELMEQLQEDCQKCREMQQQNHKDFSQYANSIQSLSAWKEEMERWKEGETLKQLPDFYIRLQDLEVKVEDNGKRFNEKEKRKAEDLTNTRDLLERVTHLNNSISMLKDRQAGLNDTIIKLEEASKSKTFEGKIIHLETSIKDMKDWQTGIDRSISAMKDEKKIEILEEKVRSVDKSLDELKINQNDMETKISDFKKETNLWKEKEITTKQAAMMESLKNVQDDLTSFQDWYTQYLMWRNSTIEPEMNKFAQKLSLIESDLQLRLKEVEKELPNLRGKLDSTIKWTEDHKKTWNELEVGQKLKSFEVKIYNHNESLENLLAWKDETSSQLQSDRNEAQKMKSDIRDIDNKVDIESQRMKDLDSWRKDELTSILKEHDSKISTVSNELDKVTQWNREISSWKDDASEKLKTFEGRISTLENNISDIFVWKEELGLWQNEIKQSFSDLDSWRENDVKLFIQNIKGRVHVLETETSDIKIWKEETSRWRSNTQENLKGLNSWRTDIDSWKSDLDFWREKDVHPFIQNIKGRVHVLETDTSDIKDWKRKVTVWKSSTEETLKGLNSWRADTESWKNDLDSWREKYIVPFINAMTEKVPILETKTSDIHDWKGKITTWTSNTDEILKGLNSWRTDTERWKNQEVTSSLTDHGTRVSKLETDGTDFSRWRENMSGWRKDVIDKDVVSRVQTLVGKVRWLEISGGDTSFLLYLMVSIIVAMVGLLVLILMRTRSLGSAEYKHYGTGSTASMGQASILDQIHTKAVEDSICVVSFHRNTQNHHKQLTDKVTQSHSSLKKIPVHTFLVHCHENLPSMHLSKLFIVYVDHNERNIILEDPDQELGDLRRTTVQAALKMGANVFIVYTHDRGSENLKDGELYNERLISVQKHKVLSPLNEQQRVLSIDNDFTQYQRSHLQNTICDIVDKKNK